MPNIIDDENESTLRSAQSIGSGAEIYEGLTDGN